MVLRCSRRFIPVATADADPVPLLPDAFVDDPSRYLHFMSGITRWEVVGEQASGIGARYRMLMHVGSAEVGGVVEVADRDSHPPVAVVRSRVVEPQRAAGAQRRVERVGVGVGVGERVPRLAGVLEHPSLERGDGAVLLLGREPGEVVVEQDPVGLVTGPGGQAVALADALGVGGDDCLALGLGEALPPLLHVLGRRAAAL